MVTATDGTPLPYMTDVGLLPDGQVALMAPTATPGNPLDCAVVTPNPPQNVTLAPYRYPMLSQSAPRFAAIPGPDVQYLSATGPRAAAAIAVPRLRDDRCARRLRPDRQRSRSCLAPSLRRGRHATRHLPHRLGEGSRSTGGSDRPGRPDRHRAARTARHDAHRCCRRPARSPRRTREMYRRSRRR